MAAGPWVGAPIALIAYGQANAAVLMQSGLGAYCRTGGR